MSERSMFPRICLIATCLIACALTVGCMDDDSSDEPAPRDCLRSRPEKGRIFIEVTIDETHPRVPITIYRGKFEYNQVVLRDELTFPSGRYDLAPDVEYAVAARYVVGDDTIFAVGGGKPSFDYEDYADARCWEFEDVRLDLRLK